MKFTAIRRLLARTACLAALVGGSLARADITNWKTNQTIPGTQGIVPGPGVNLYGWNTASHNLQYADLSGIANLTGADFFSSWLDFARFNGTNLSGGNLNGTSLTATDLTDATITYSHFNFTNLTANQLYSTASYKSHDLTGIDIGQNTLSGWSFAGQQLNGATLLFSNISGADFSNALVTNTNLAATGLTRQQLVSTASYVNHDLSGLKIYNTALPGIDLSHQKLSSADMSNGNFVGANFSGANLTNASLGYSNFTNADFSGATITGASLDSPSSYLTPQQLYSTASYQNHDLSGVQFTHNNVSGWNFTGQNLTGADFAKANYSLADFRGALGFTTGFGGSTNTILPDGSIHGLNLPAGQTLVIRDYPLGITVQSAMSMTGTSSLNMQFSSTGWGSTMSLASGVVPSLAGTLGLLLAPGVDRQTLLGTTYHLFNWNGQLPAGSHFDQVVSLPGFVWDTSALYTSGDVTLLAIPEPTGAVLGAAGALIALVGLGLRRR